MNTAVNSSFETALEHPAPHNNQADHMYTLYGGRFTRASIVQMVMAEGDIGYELRNVDIFNAEHRQPECLSDDPEAVLKCFFIQAVRY